MKRIFIILIITGCLAGCYVPNRARFEKSVKETIAIGMSSSEVIGRLGQMNLRCDTSRPDRDGRLTCSRVRQRLWPSSCIERVNLMFSPVDDSVRAIEVPSILCAGL